MNRRTLEEALERHFGFSSFRQGQAAILEAVLAGRDCLAILPTGGGKSLCYQLPALLRPGLTLVISPLIALMKDQVDSLQKIGVQATFINSALTSSQMQQRLFGMGEGHYSLVYVAPERFKSERFVDAISPVKVSLCAIDEAHCISMWGHDFRPDYTRLREVLVVLGDPQVIALTATATPEVREDIRVQLGLNEPPRSEPVTIVSGFARPNLTLAVSRVDSHARKLQRLLHVLERHPTGIVYCATRAMVDKVCAKLRSSAVSAIPYHAGMSDADRKRAQDLFIEGEVPVVVATNAFGMGIDRADLRAIVHWDLPGSIEAFYQEAGRAGRDGEPARCEILFNYADVRTQEFFIEGTNPSRKLVLDVSHILLEMCQRGPVLCNADRIAGRLGRSANVMAVSTALGKLEKAGFIRRTLEPQSSLTLVEIADARVDLSPTLHALAQKAERDRSRLRRLLRYIDARSCRHQNILQHFGDPTPVVDCRKCDNCMRIMGQHETREPTDEEWLEIQKVLSCVARMRARFGRARIAQVLSGSKDRAVLQSNLHKLPTYGVMAKRKLSYIRSLIDALQDEGCVETVGQEFPTLQLTELGREVMWRRKSIRLTWPGDRTSQMAKSGAASKRKAVAKTQPPQMAGAPSSGNEDVALTGPLPRTMLVIADELKKWRGQVAAAKKMAPYFILSNATVDEIARKQPSSIEDLHEIKGIGPKKIELFGAEILAIVKT